MDTELIDRIYECGFVPKLWPQVLRDTSRISESAGAFAGVPAEIGKNR
jgi:hypothetical protein